MPRCLWSCSCRMGSASSARCRPPVCSCRSAARAVVRRAASAIPMAGVRSRTGAGQPLQQPTNSSMPVHTRMSSRTSSRAGLSSTISPRRPALHRQPRFRPSRWRQPRSRRLHVASRACTRCLRRAASRSRGSESEMHAQLSERKRALREGRAATLLLQQPPYPFTRSTEACLRDERLREEPQNKKPARRLRATVRVGSASYGRPVWLGRRCQSLAPVHFLLCTEGTIHPKKWRRYFVRSHRPSCPHRHWLQFVHFTSRLFVRCRTAGMTTHIT